MKTFLPSAFALLGACTMPAVFPLPAAAQPGPVIAPGKAGPPSAQQLAGRRASSAIEATIAEIMARPADYAGRNVTVTSELEEVFTPWSLKLDEERPLSGGIDNDLLVVSAEPLVTMGYDPSWVNRKISVTGTIHLLQAGDFRREYGRGVDDRLLRRYEGKPALVATSMTKVE